MVPAKKKSISSSTMKLSVNISGDSKNRESMSTFLSELVDFPYLRLVTYESMNSRTFAQFCLTVLQNGFKSISKPKRLKAVRETGCAKRDINIIFT